MSSNGFLTPIHLDSLKLPHCCGWRITMQRYRLRVGPNRDWLLETPTGPIAVLLLRHKSFWWQTVAGITLQTAESEHLVLWFFRRGNSSSWRRMRVLFRYP